MKVRLSGRAGGGLGGVGGQAFLITVLPPHPSMDTLKRGTKDDLCDNSIAAYIHILSTSCGCYRKKGG